jgi:hypothetical protein
MERTEDNFGNEEARQFLRIQATRLIGVIHEVVSDPQRLPPADDGEGMLMPCVEILALLCERYDVAPPPVATVRAWHEAYMKAFDRGFDALEAPASFKAPRRKVIDKTFRWLESLAESYHAE